MFTHLAGPFVVGIDAGGTKTRCVVMTPDGTVAGSATGPGANPNSGGDRAGALKYALHEALGRLDPAGVRGGVFGMAGAGAAGRPAAVEAADSAWAACALPGRPTVVTDIAVAFAAGTTSSSGIVVFAGTGAGAAVIRDGEIVRRADGYGPLVGDEGSAVWIGKEGTRAALQALDGRGAPTLLAESIPRAMLGSQFDASLVPPGAVPELLPADDLIVGSGGGVATLCRVGSSGCGELTQAIIKEVYGQTAAALGRLGPVVCAAAMAGDEVARRITAEAAEWLLRDVDAVADAADLAAPVVMAGSVLSNGPVADAVRAGLLERFAAEPSLAEDGARGAAGMALRGIRLH